MDYIVSGKSPDVAQAVVPHTQNPDGTVSPIGASTPQPVATPAGARVAQTPVVTSASAYAAGNAVGGLLTFAGSARVAAGGGIIESALLRDKSGNSASYDLFLFDSAPTAPVDKTAYALGTDLSKAIGSIAFSGTVNGGTPGLINVDGLAKKYQLGAGTSLYGVLVTRGTPTFTGIADVTVDLMLMPD